MNRVCPPTATLEQMLRGDCPDIAALESHLGECAACRQALDRMTPPLTVAGADDSLLEVSPEVEADWQAHHGRLQVGLIGQMFDRFTGRDSRPLPTIPGYYVESLLGEGGAGVVYRARHEQLQRLVALKMLRPGTFDRAAGRARFRREAEVLSRLRHPHVVHLYDFGEAASDKGPTVPYMVLELVEGGTLGERVNHQPVPARTAAAVVELLARALHVVHQQGIIHRDLKPGNILLAPVQGRGFDSGVSALDLEHWTPKITDFGLARQLDGGASEWTKTRDVLGTPAYMAPEQAGETRELTPAVDVYALGVILYELLTGFPPFRARDWVELIVQVKEQEPVTLSRLLSGIPRDLETICHKCLEKSPARRYASAEALADDCRRFLEGRAIQARPATALEKFWKWCRRNPWIAGLSMTVFLLLVVGLGVTTWLSWVAERRREETALALENLKAEQGRTNEALSAEKRRREQARQALEAITSEMIPDLIARNTDMTREQRQFLARALMQYQEFARDTANDEVSRVGVAEAQLRVAQFQRALAQLAEARRSAEEARESWEKLFAEFPANHEYGRKLALTCWLQAVLLRDLGEKKESEPYARRALTLIQSLRKAGVSDARVELQFCDCMNTLATILRQTGRLEEAEEQWRTLLPLREKLAERFPHTAEHGIGLLWVHLNLALLFQQTSRLEEADAEIQKALAVGTPLAEEHSSSPDCPQWLARCHDVRGDILCSLRGAAKGEPEYRAAVTILTELYRRYPGRPGIRNELASSMVHVAQMLLEQGRRDEGRRWLEDAEPHHQAALAAEPRNLAYRYSYRNNRRSLAESLVEQGNHVAAARVVEQWTETAVDVRMDSYHAAGCLGRCVAEVQKDEALTAVQRHEAARKYGDRALQLLKQATGSGFKDGEALKKNPALEPLRGRHDFQELIDGLTR